MGSKLQMDSVIWLSTSGSGLLSLKKTKAKKKTVQVMEVLINPSHKSFGQERWHKRWKNRDEAAYLSWHQALYFRVS